MIESESPYSSKTASVSGPIVMIALFWGLFPGVWAPGGDAYNVLILQVAAGG